MGKGTGSGTKHSILARSAFEVTVNHLLRAGKHWREGLPKGVTENVIVGQPERWARFSRVILCPKNNEEMVVGYIKTD
ncbi:MAG: hypothetical protein CM15mP48_0150 [Candidatus Poseidoniales archaeon]|nr:MAG: hypothetical protein CM15mP48_0150 [Candidatus Poseidoniales archaeon]